MAHAYGILSAVNAKLNTLFKDYTNEARANTLSKVPDFMFVSVNRAIDASPDILIDPNVNATVSKPILAATGDDFAPVYMCIVGNINKPIIDKMPVFVDRKGNQGYGIAIVLGVPEILFTESMTSDQAAVMLKDLYFRLLSMDPGMQFEVSPAIIRLYKSPKVFIPSYDITMTIAAIACININLRNWYFVNLPGGGDPVEPKEALSAFTDKELTPEIKERLTKTFNKYAKNIGDLNSAVGNGRLLKSFMYGDK